MDKRIFILVFIGLLMTSNCTLFNNEKDEPTPEIPGKLVFSAPDDNGRYQIYSSLTNGSKRKQLTSSGAEGAEFFNPSWSNDGTQIALTSTLNNTSEGLSLYLMDADGSNLRPLKERPNTDIVTLGNNPTWSPDDSKIAFDFCINCELGGRNSELFIYDFDTDDVTQITNNPAVDDFPNWNTNGDLIAFSSGREYENLDTLSFRKDLYEIDINTKTETKLTDTGNATIPVWNPVENMIFYEWNIMENNVYRFDIVSKEIQIIDPGLEFSGSTQFSKGGTRLIIFGRESESSSPEIRFFRLIERNLELIESDQSNDFLRAARDFDWYYNENDI